MMISCQVILIPMFIMVNHLALTITMATLSSNATTNYGMVMAGATLTYLFPFTLYIFLQKQFVEVITMGGVKG